MILKDAQISWEGERERERERESERERERAIRVSMRDSSTSVQLKTGI